MSLIKIAAGLACSFLIVLSTLLILTENPEKAAYEKTVESIMLQEGMSSAQEVIDAYPELLDIKSQINRITYLNSNIYNMTSGPAPDVSRAESLQIHDYAQEIRELRSSIQENLSRLAVASIAHQP